VRVSETTVTVVLLPVSSVIVVAHRANL
jgi:hypothetical protein